MGFKNRTYTLAYLRILMDFFYQPNIQHKAAQTEDNIGKS